MLQFLYGAWEWIVAIGVVIGIVSVLLAFWKYINRATGKHPVMNCLSTLGIIVTCVLLCISCIVSMLFCEVPDVFGISVKEAKGKLSDADLKMVLQPGLAMSDILPDTVIWQSIGAGKIIPKGTEITIYIDENAAESPAEQMVVVPSVIGKEQMEATALIRKNNLQFQIWWTEENDLPAEQYYIIDQSIPAGSSVPAGTLIKLEVSPYQLEGE